MRFKKLARKVYKFAKKDKQRFLVILIFLIGVLWWIGAEDTYRKNVLTALLVLAIASVCLIIYKLLQPKTSLLKRKFTAKQLHDICEVDKLTGLEFEHYLAPIFAKQGYKVEVTQGSGDYGADLVLIKNHRKYVVQAKCYSSNIGVSAVQQIAAAVPYYKAHGAMVVTNQYYTKAAQNLASVNGVRLIDRDELAGMISRANENDGWKVNITQFFRNIYKRRKEKTRNL